MISLRPAVPHEKEWVYLVKKKALGPYVIATWGAWFEKIQWEFFLETFDEINPEIIEWHGADAGMWRVDRQDDQIFLADLYLLPTFQNLGIGSVLIEQLKSEARDRGIPLQLTVLMVNQSARRFYERHGLICSEEIPNHYVMTYHG